ncbi:MAG: hypothetical protein LBE13_17915 [Bacteroidales bacterium]|jgi:hypothetical protein|nr:hypothetical protein [Bacteroidales bacterium]
MKELRRIFLSLFMSVSGFVYAQDLVIPTNDFLLNDQKTKTNLTNSRSISRVSYPLFRIVLGED